MIDKYRVQKSVKKDIMSQKFPSNLGSTAKSTVSFFWISFQGIQKNPNTSQLGVHGLSAHGFSTERQDQRGHFASYGLGAHGFKTERAKTSRGHFASFVGSKNAPTTLEILIIFSKKSPMLKIEVGFFCNYFFFLPIYNP